MWSTMEYFQAAMYVNHFDYPGAMRGRHYEYPVSYYVEKDGETKFWDGGQCEILEEGSHNEEEQGEGKGQGWGVITWNNNSPPQGHDDDDDQDLQIALALAEEEDAGGSHLRAGPDQDLHTDQELAKRFSDLDSVPHVPRVNAEKPSVGGLQDKQRLADRLRYRGLAERRVAGDGNCQFRALSDQLHRTSDHHMSVREQVVCQLAENPNCYSSYVPMNYDKYLENMARDGEWGDHVTLQAAADLYGMKISLITSFKETCFIEIIPAKQKSQRGLYLSFWSEIHYNSIQLLEDGVNATEDEEWVTLDD